MKLWRLFYRLHYKVIQSPTQLSNGKQSTGGFGWFIDDQNNEKTVSHTGGLNSFRALFWRDLKITKPLLHLPSA